MTKSRKSRVSKGTKETKSEDIKQSERDETQGDLESRSTTSEESPQISQVPPISSSISEDTEQSQGTSENVSKPEDTKLSQGTSESVSKSEKSKLSQSTSEIDSEYPSCPESRGTTSDESQQTAQAMVTSTALRGAATASSTTKTRRKILVPRRPRVEGDKRRKSASRVAEPRRRDAPVSNEKNSISRASTSSRAKADTQIKYMPKRLGKYNLRNRSKYDNLKPNPLDEAYSPPSITDLSLSSLNIEESVSTGTHQDDSDISEYSAHETSDSENGTL